MKFKIKFQRRYSIFISILACAMAIWMMVRNFGFPAETVLSFAIICFALLAFIIVIAAAIAYVSRWFADRRE